MAKTRFSINLKTFFDIGNKGGSHGIHLFVSKTPSFICVAVVVVKARRPKVRHRLVLLVTSWLLGRYHWNQRGRIVCHVLGGVHRRRNLSASSATMLGDGSRERLG
ncbi:hypothetical protein ES319_D04G168100v1 [Gossypium barbadense]|uniref:Uncharacterized protein n=1 Tax=Gossypium barbadense TaxID=3634 RepID=A0A5J5S159_GOSBA|nr:hypothetical protein ES319_D04G168100v1 [Gossypium barbadense]